MVEARVRDRQRPENKLATRLVHGGILAGAVMAFSRLGFAKTRVEDILEAAGIARRTFYRYFTSKEDVLVAIYDVATAELLRAMRSGVSQPEETHAHTDRLPPRMRAILRELDVYLDYHVENAPLLRVLVGQALRTDSPLFAVRQKFREELVSLIDAAVREGAGAHAGHDRMVYAGLVSALEGLSLDLLTQDPAARGAHSSEDLAERVTRAKRAMHLLITRSLSPA